MIEDKRTTVDFAFKIFHIYVNKEFSIQERTKAVKEALIKWYKEKVLKIIKNRIIRYLKYLDYRPKEIKVRNLNVRWGSCTKDGKLIFNWRIAMAPISAIDYIIVHELCHLKDATHSNKFWNIVQSLFPNYEKWKEWLRINGLNLDLRI